MNSLHLRLPALVLLATALPSFAADLRMKASTTWAENIGRSSSPVDWRDTLVGEASVSAGLGRQLASGLTAGVSAEAATFASPRFDRLGYATLGASAQLQYKFGLGALAPVVQADAGLTAREARINGDDGYTASASIGLSKRFTETWRARVAGDWQQHYAANEPFDTHSQRLIGELAWDFHPSWRLTYGYGRQWADFTATASERIWNRATSGGLGAAIANYYNTTPTYVTDAYGPGWTTYRVEGEVELWWLELSPALSERTSLSFRYDSVFAKNIVNVKYRQDLWTLSVLHAF
ncbi:MAG TPA: hypothetical protein VGD88_04160 [Opitutaceae bacterium]